MMRQLHRSPSTRGSGGDLRLIVDTTTEAARRRPAVDGRGSLESDYVSKFRSARVRRYAVIIVALAIVLWAVRFVVAPIPQL